MGSTFVWWELMNRDPGMAAAFYGALFGRTARKSGHADLDYRQFEASGVGVGGPRRSPPVAADAGMPPRWFPFTSVPNLEDAVAGFLSAGGSAHPGQFSVPDVGRIAVIADPQGALLNLIAPVGDGPATSFAPGKPGHGGWHEFLAMPGAASLAFYAAQFGRTQSGAIEMGEQGSYSLVGIANGPSIGGMMTDHALKRPAWVIVFNVDGAAAV